MRTDHPRRMVILLVLASLALMIVIPNNAIIWDNDHVGLALDWHEVQAVAQAAGVSAAELAQGMKAEGANYLVIKEDTLARLRQVGRIQVLTGWELCQLAQLLHSDDVIREHVIDNPDFRLQDSYILTGNKELFDRLLERLSQRLPNKVRSILVPTDTDNYILQVQGRWDQLASIGVGISPVDVVQVKALGFAPVLAWGDGGKTTVEIDADLSYLAQVRPTVVIPGSVAEANQRQVGSALSKLNILQGVLEFEPAAQAAKVAAASGYNTVRVYERPVHTIYQEYLLAVRDRNVRLVIPHLLWQVPAGQGDISLVEANEIHLNRTAAAITAAGMKLGEPQPFEPRMANRWLLAAIIGLMPAAFFKLRGWPRWARIGISLGLAVVTLLLPAEAAIWWRKAVALAVAGWVPAQATLCVQAAAQQEKARGTPLITGCMTLIQATVLTLIGAIVIQGLLGDITFLLKLDSFAGIKMAYTITIAFVLAHVYRQRWKGQYWWWQKQIAPVEIAALGILAVAVWVLFNRSGNTSVIPIPAWELKARSFLEAVFFARPRTKEFLVGHPALLLAAAGWGKDKFYQPYLVALAAVGQASLMNTFVHLHTPFLVSLIRSLLGLGIGMLVGACLWAVGYLVLVIGRGKRYA
ncbi:MAG: hypothetical protein GX489_04630 [Firmicutes bacterium]|nr:hypothetical protein [Bacillota bacterium]